ncbi:uncharacterized protein [Henckelia pumila]|uniref:uncharacterized protein n=1 Tax=Henckelia pumila TaxID=405737 RepID=UPI003C6E7DE1
MSVSHSILEWWNRIVMRLEQPDIEFASIVLWVVWQNRNDVVWNGRGKFATSIFQSAIQMLSLFKTTSLSAASHQQPPQLIHNSIWMPPRENFLKCNTDVAVVEGYFSPTIAEAIGVREALSWMKTKGFSRVFVESYAKVVIDALNSGELADSSSLGLVLHDCIILSKDFRYCNFAFAYRSTNQAAYA